MLLVPKELLGDNLLLALQIALGLFLGFLGIVLATIVMTGGAFWLGFRPIQESLDNVLNYNT